MRGYDLKGQAMGQGPFSPLKSSSQSAANRRRSTRIDYQTPVVLSGRDAAGQAYRDETITEIVNIHGARIRTRRKILVGMLVSVECPKTGRSSKAVCVNVYEPTLQEPHPAIAIQILKPGNMWGVEDPPGDWAAVAAAMGRPASPADSSWSGVASPQSVSAPMVKPFIADADLADRAEKVTEDSLARLRSEADAIQLNTLAAFDERLGEKMSEAEARLMQHVEAATTEMAATIQALKSNLVGEMVQSTLDELRAHIEAISNEREASLIRRVDQVVSDASERIASRSNQEAVSLEKAFEHRVELQLRMAESDLSSRVSKTVQELEEILNTFRASFSEGLAAEHEKAMIEAEQAVRARVAGLLSSILSQAAGTPVVPAPTLDK